MSSANGDFDLTMDEVRDVVRFAADCAQRLIPEFAAESPEDSRPRDALNAARAFAEGAARTNLQRTTAFAAHRAAKSVSTEAAQLAALACGDAAGAAYLHPIAKATQVGHILRSAACAARVAELKAADRSAAIGEEISTLAERASDSVLHVLRRYPNAPQGSSRLAQLMSALDTAIRARNEAN